jgi:cell fate regulator YaaT (PSP1 superfamily)
MNRSKFSAEGTSILKANKKGALDQLYGQNQTDVYDWLGDVEMPFNCDACTIVEVKFKGSRKQFYRNLTGTKLKNGQLVVVAGSKGGYDVGHVSLTGELVRLQLKKKKMRLRTVFKKIHRRANAADEIKWRQGKELELVTLYRARVLAQALNLPMKLTDVDYQGDCRKATFYYTASARVDYRELIKNLFDAFDVQIEMCQIGIREEVNRLGDVGPCGSALCCHTWSPNFKANYSFTARSESALSRKINKFDCCITDEMVGEDPGKYAKRKEKLSPG